VRDSGSSIDIGNLTEQQQAFLQEKVTSIQAIWRGYIVRKRLQLIKEYYLNGIEGGQFDDTIDETSLLQNPQIMVSHFQPVPTT